MLGLSQILCYLHRVGCPYHSKTRCLWRRNRLFLGSKNLDIINKSSKSSDAYRLETQTAQPRGKLAGICLPTPFPHPLQNRVPRVRILLPLPKIWPGIPWNSGLFLCFGVAGMRSTMSLSMACILRFSRFCSYPFLAFPYGTSSINHQKSGVLSPVLLASVKN